MMMRNKSRATEANQLVALVSSPSARVYERNKRPSVSSTFLSPQFRIFTAVHEASIASSWRRTLPGTTHEHNPPLEASDAPRLASGEALMQACERLARVLRSHRGLVVALAAPFALVLYFSHSSLAFNSRSSSDSVPLAVVKLSGRPHAKLARAAINPGEFSIGVVLCSTTRGVENVEWDHLALTSIMLPSLKSTMEDEYTYFLYIGVDTDDEVYSTREAKSTLSRLAGDNISVIIDAFPRVGQRIPMNQILRRAYEDGMDYIVRVNDDTEFASMMWTTLSISELMRGTPANIGVVGPIVSGPPNVNGNILTHDMVHRTHMDIFNGEYYPECFENAWIDDWITLVYGHRSRAIWEWRVHHHTDHHGTRYRTQKRQKRWLVGKVKDGRRTIDLWIQARN